MNVKGPWDSQGSKVLINGPSFESIIKTEQTIFRND